MNIKTIQIDSSHGKPAEYTYRCHEKPAEILTVIFPGQAYYKDAPLLWYSAIPAYEAGSDVLSIEYGFHANRGGSTNSDIGETVEEISGALKNFLNKHRYRKVIFISKSIGTYIVSILCQKTFSNVKDHIFQTPLEPTVEFIQTTPNALVLVGDNDPAFGSGAMAKIRGRENVRLVSFPDANHVLEVAGNYARSLEYLTKVASETFGFIEEAVNAE